MHFTKENLKEYPSDPINKKIIEELQYNKFITLDELNKIDSCNHLILNALEYFSNQYNSIKIRNHIFKLINLSVFNIYSLIWTAQSIGCHEAVTSLVVHMRQYLGDTIEMVEISEYACETLISDDIIYKMKQKEKNHKSRKYIDLTLHFIRTLSKEYRELSEINDKILLMLKEKIKS
jgi:hypothetical protein